LVQTLQISDGDHQGSMVMPVSLAPIETPAGTASADVQKDEAHRGRLVDVWFAYFAVSDFAEAQQRWPSVVRCE
jgi:hypothetical protein